MRLTLTQALCSAALMVFGFGCSPPPPPTPPPTPPAPPPPPPKKCNTLKDECKAKAGTKVLVPEGVGYSFEPPKGWYYAKLPDSTVAQVGESGAVVVATSFEKPKGGNKRYAARASKVESLTELVGITPGNIKGALLQRPVRNEIAGLKMQLWEAGSAKRGEDKGGLLIVSADVEKHELLIVGFAPKDDQDGTNAIMGVLNTLAPEASEEKAESKDAKGDST